MVYLFMHNELPPRHPSCFYGFLLPDRFWTPSSCVHKHIYDQPLIHDGLSACCGEYARVIPKRIDWFSLLTTFLDKIVLNPPFGWDVFFYYCSSHEGIGNWELVGPSVCVSVIMRLNKCKLTREHMEVLQAVQADRNFAGLVFLLSMCFHFKLCLCTQGSIWGHHDTDTRCTFIISDADNGIVTGLFSGGLPIII